MHKQFRHYLGAHGGKILIWHAYDLVFAYFLTRHLGLPPETMGLVTMALMMFGALADPVAGWLIGNGADAARRLARLQRWGAVSSVVAFLVLFSSPGRLAPPLHALCVGLAFQICYKLYDVPQNALMSVLSHDNREVLQLSTGRYLLSAAARILVACAAYPLLGADASGFGWRGLPLVALLCAPALFSSFLFARTVERMPRAADSGGARAALDTSRRSLPQLPAQMPWLLLAALIHAGLASVMGRVLPYLGDRSHALAAFSLGTLLLLPLFKQLATRCGEHVAFLSAALLAAGACLCLPWCFRLDGIAGSLGLDAFAFLYGGGTFAGTMLLWGTAANLIHLHYAKTAQRSDALSYGVFSFACKSGIGLSMLALGHVLGPLTPSGSIEGVHAMDKAAALGAAGAIASAMMIHRTLRSLGQPRSAPAARPHAATAIRDKRCPPIT